MARQGLPIKCVEELRALYDQGVNKNQAHIALGLAEATVYRYYAKWDALTSPTAFDLDHLAPQVKNHYTYEANKRRMSVYALIGRVLNNVATDDLFAAVCDTEEEETNVDS